MLVLFSPLRSAFGHFQSQETKLDRALVHLSITTLCSHSADIQEPFFFPSEESPQKSKTRILPCARLREAGSSPPGSFLRGS